MALRDCAVPFAFCLHPHNEPCRVRQSKSEPGAVATGSGDRYARVTQNNYPVATAPGSEFISRSRRSRYRTQCVSHVAKLSQA